MVEEDIRLSTEEIKKFIKEPLTDKQIEIIKYFMALAAVITYEGIMTQ